MKYATKKPQYRIIVPLDDARTKLPAAQTVTDFLEASDDVVHMRSFCWIVLNHFGYKTLQEFKAVLAR